MITYQLQILPSQFDNGWANGINKWGSIPGTIGEPPFDHAVIWPAAAYSAYKVYELQDMQTTSLSDPPHGFVAIDDYGDAVGYRSLEYVGDIMTPAYVVDLATGPGAPGD